MKRKRSQTQSQRPTKKARTSSFIPVAGYQKSRELHKQPKMELKAFDNATTTTAFSTIAGPPVPVCLNTIVNGAELYQRVGRKVYNRSLHFRGAIQPNGASMETHARVIIYYDSSSNKAFPAIADFLKDANAAAATTHLSEINLDNRSRFQIIRDYQVLLGEASALAGTVEIIPDPIKNSLNVDFFIKLRGLETIYNVTNGGTIADITTGSINVVFLGDANCATYSMTWHSRLRYYD